MEERLYCRGLLYELESLGHLSEPDMKRRVIGDQIDVPVTSFSIYILVADPRI